MKQATLSILFFCLISSCQPKSETYSRVEENFVDIEDTAYILTFDSVTNIHGQLISRAVSVTKENDHLIKIQNYMNSGLGSVHITFLIDQNLKIKSAIFNSTEDFIDESSTEFFIENPLLAFNFNPFIKDLKGLQGRYSFVLKTVRKPAAEGEKSIITYRTIHGKFRNGS